MVFLIFFATFFSAQAQETDTTKKSAQETAEDQLINRLEDMQKKIDRLEAESAARKKLQITEEEKEQKEKEVLTAAGREYTLLSKGTLELEYKVAYAYSSRDVIQDALNIERTYDHTITHTISGTYGILDNLSLSTSLPFVYRYNKVDTDAEMDETDVGDISITFQWEPVKKQTGGYSIILNAGANLPTGRSPYKIDPDSELSTGSGTYSYTVGFSLSQPIDPLVVFGSASYTYTQEVSGLNTPLSNQILRRADTGDEISLGIGFGYALSYMVSLSQQVAFTYIMGSDYGFQKSSAQNASYSSAAFIIGAGWRLSTKTTLYTSLELGLTSDRPDFSFSMRVPLDFVI